MAPVDLILKLQTSATAIRRQVVQMAFEGQTSHVGSALSCAEILAVLYFHVMDIDPLGLRQGDRFILSKGHGVMAWYAALALRGFFPVQRLKEYAVDGSVLGEHPHRGSVPGIEVTTGSLGHGLSIASGMALARAMDQTPGKVFVLLSDGECNEGSIWEAAMYAAQAKLDNLMAIIDDNHMQALGNSRAINALEPLKDKWDAFGWETFEVNGHDAQGLLDAIQKMNAPNGKPKVLIARTCLGKGVSFMENELLWHYQIPSQEQVNQALTELGSK